MFSVVLRNTSPPRPSRPPCILFQMSVVLDVVAFEFSGAAEHAGSCEAAFAMLQFAPQNTPASQANVELVSSASINMISIVAVHRVWGYRCIDAGRGGDARGDAAGSDSG